jgi:hypothetical protein
VDDRSGDLLLMTDCKECGLNCNFMISDTCLVEDGHVRMVTLSLHHPGQHTV